MTDQDRHVEATLRAIYDARAVRPTSDLRDRIDAIPGTVSAPWGVVRRSLLFASSLTAATIGGLVILSVARNLPRMIAPDPGAQPLTQFDPLHPGAGLVSLTGVTFEGLRTAYNTIGVLFVTGLGAWILIQWFRSLGHAPVPKRPRPAQTRRQKLIGLAQVAVILGTGLAVNMAFTRSPIDAGAVGGSGIGFREQLEGGSTTTYQVNGSITHSFGPRDVYAVSAGEPLTYIVSVRNQWPIAVRLLGRWSDSKASTDIAAPAGSSPTGLGLLRDPTRMDSSISNVRPFQPVDLAPGAEVAIVVAEVGKSCADPAASIPSGGATSANPSAPLVEFVYEVFGIQGVEAIVLSPEVVVPSTCR